MNQVSLDPVAAILSLSIVNKCEEVAFPEHLIALKTKGKLFKAETTYKGGNWDLLVLITSNFPKDLPSIYINDPSSLKPFGHINWLGDICYKDKQGIVVDIKQPSKVLQACVLEALDTLHIHANDETQLDIQLEYEAYWESFPSHFKETMCFIEPPEKFSVLTAYIDHKNERKITIPSYFAIIQDTLHINALYQPLKSIEKKKRSKIPFIRLNKFTLPPSPLTHWSTEEIVGLIKKNSNPADYAAFIEWANKQKWDNFFGVLLSHPKPNGDLALWGIQFNRKEKAKHPIVDQHNQWKNIPIHIKHQSNAYLTERGGGYKSLSNKNILIIGCGAVGGHIANNLAKCGLGKMTLVDNDNLTSDNLHRHVLGGAYINPLIEISKVFALSYSLESNLPNIKVTPRKETLNNIIEYIDFNIFDVVILATGDFNAELEFNSLHHNGHFSTPVIYAWQDGFGVGGHTMQIGSPSNVGCLKCLYTRSSGFKPHSKTSFIEQGQTISKHLGGCTGVFTPYSYIDAIQTSILTTRAILRVLDGDKKNVFYSWKGSDQELKDNGYKASTWFQKSKDSQHVDETLYIASNCDVCGSNNPI